VSCWQACPSACHPGDIGARAAAAAASVASGAAQWSVLGGAAGGGHHGASVLERLGFMERRVEAMGAAVHKGEVRALAWVCTGMQAHMRVRAIAYGCVHSWECAQGAPVALAAGPLCVHAQPR